ncbi:MAG: Stk1 family PASTA domain-containing Ser/Thr kinase [Actinobacteria bacterium]|nr:Stk1 family PASTA domain-containing Ser/Thr kinase [Actinomycetota bacterium]
MDETTPLGSADRRVLAGRYALRGPLGTGGMAEVHLGHDRVLERDVAIKVMHDHHAQDPTFVARFRREAQAAARLSHPNVVAVYDTGEDDGRPFIVMEYVAGPSVADLLAGGDVPPDRAVEIADEAARGLHYAHDRGLVHRDVKPGNILVADDGRVKVADFGIARAVSSETLTQTATVLGTAAYIAPEQARGDPVDRRTDVYALGCVLYEMLTGRQPFGGESAVAVAYQHISQPPTPPSQLDPSLSEDLEAVVLKAMAKDPADRYQSARDLHLDLRRVLAGSAVAAPVGAAYAATQALSPDSAGETEVLRPATATRRLEPPEEERPRRRWIPLLVALLALALLGLGAWLLLGDVVGTEVRVPDLAGEPSDAARARLRRLGLEPRAGDRVSSDEFGVDEVVRTRPDAGSRVEEGSVVRLDVSSGPATVDVPEVEGLSQDDARAALEGAELVVDRIVQTPSDGFDQGVAVDSDPDAGAEVEEGTGVTLVVSSGPATFTLPRVVGLGEDEARTALETACEDEAPCVSVHLSRVFDDQYAQGVVLAQEPAGDTQVEVGSTVSIVVSRGPESEPTPTAEEEEPATTPDEEQPAPQEENPNDEERAKEAEEAASERAEKAASERAKREKQAREARQNAREEARKAREDAAKEGGQAGGG